MWDSAKFRSQFMSSSFSSCHACQSIIKMKLHVHFFSVSPFRKFEMTDCANFCRHFGGPIFNSIKMTRTFSNCHVRQFSFELTEYFRFLSVLLFRKFEMTDCAKFCRYAEWPSIFNNIKITSCFSSRHVRPSSLKLSLYLQFSSSHPFGKFKMTDCAKFCRQFMSSTFSSCHACQSNFKLTLYFLFSNFPNESLLKN